jgi:hypothetical protein
LFSVNIAVSSAEVISANVVSVTTATDHGLALDDIVNITAGRLQNTIDGVIYNSPDDTHAKFDTSSEHDFTAHIYADDNSTVEFSGFTAPAWNTTHELLQVPNRNQIVVPIPSGETIPPVLTDNEIVYEDRPAGLLGEWVVTDVISTTEFKFTVSGVPDLPINPITGLEYVALKNVSVHACADIDRAREIYTAIKPSTLTLFVIFADLDVSKDRKNMSDFVATPTNAEEARLLLAQNFSTVVFFDISDQLSGADAQEQACGEVFEALMKVLYVYRKDNYKSQFETITLGHGSDVNNTSYYTHVYDWQLSLLIDRNVGFADHRDVALRNLNYDLHPFDADNPETWELRIDLDEDS